MRQYSWLLSFVSFVLCSACAPLDNELVDWAHGARAGTVLEPLTPQTAKAMLASCLPGNAELPADRQYVLVRYRTVRLHRKVVASAPLELGLRRGDKVELWPGDCNSGQMARVEHILAPLSNQ